MYSNHKSNTKIVECGVERWQSKWFKTGIVTMVSIKLFWQRKLSKSSIATRRRRYNINIYVCIRHIILEKGPIYGLPRSRYLFLSSRTNAMFFDTKIGP